MPDDEEQFRKAVKACVDGFTALAGKTILLIALSKFAEPDVQGLVPLAGGSERAEVLAELDSDPVATLLQGVNKKGKGVGNLVHNRGQRPPQRELIHIMDSMKGERSQ